MDPLTVLGVSVVIFFVLLAIGMRVSFALASMCIAFIILMPGSVSIVSLIPRMVSQLARAWPLMAVPLFILAGEILKFGVAQRLVNISNIFFGNLRGGLAIVDVVASFFFGGISGSAAAEVAAIGGVMIPSMVKEGYDPEFATVVTICSSVLGPIVPPSIIMIVFAWITEGSVAALFAAGYIPGFFLMLAMSSLAYYYSVKRGYPAYPRPSFRVGLRLFADGLPAVGMIIIIMGGILSGIFTATEAAAVAVVYGLLISAFIYRVLKWSDIPEILISTVKTTGIVGLLIGFAVCFSWLLSYVRIPYTFTDWIISLHLGPTQYMLVVVLIMLILGRFMNPVAALLMTIPLLYPPAVKLGIHQLHFGIIVTVSLAFGHVTPPVGVSLFIGSAMSGVPMSRLVGPLVPFLAVMIGVNIILIFWPQAVLFIPKLLGYA